MTLRESDGRIVPLKSGDRSDGMKPSNIGAGKAARTSRDRDRASSVLRDGITVHGVLSATAGGSIAVLVRIGGCQAHTASGLCTNSNVVTVLPRLVLPSAG